MKTTSVKKTLDSVIFGAFNDTRAAVNTGKKDFNNNFIDGLVKLFEPFDPISDAEKEGDKNIENTSLAAIIDEIKFLKNKINEDWGEWGKQWTDKYNFICKCKKEDAENYAIYELTREKKIKGKRLIQKSTYYVKDKGFSGFKFYRKTFEEYICVKRKGGANAPKPLWGYEIYSDSVKANRNLMVIDDKFPSLEYEISHEMKKEKLIYRCLYFVKDSDEVRSQFYQ